MRPFLECGHKYSAQCYPCHVQSMDLVPAIVESASKDAMSDIVKSELFSTVENPTQVY
jgi:hypothetical protein